MNKILFCLILTVILIISISSEAKKTEKECKGIREHWSCESGTQECHRLCENKKIRKDIPCLTNCELSCVCLPGFLREGVDGECVAEAECYLNKTINANEGVKNRTKLN